ARGASCLLEMKKISKNTLPALRILFLMFTLVIRVVGLILTGTHAKYEAPKYAIQNSNSEYDLDVEVITVALFVSPYLMGSIGVAILVIPKELPCKGIGQMVWTIFRIFIGHYLLDMATPYGLPYSLIYAVCSISILVWGRRSPWNYHKYDWIIRHPGQDFDETVEVYLNVTFAITSLLVNTFMIIMAIGRFGDIGKSLRNLW
ncbi:unnamed protein product, partial [Meganyctiphanes norvegica]